MTARLAMALCPVCMTICACVPEGPPTGDAPAQRTTASPIATAKATDQPLGAAFSDDFDRDSLGRDWRPLSDAWRIVDGELCGEGAKNRGVWLRRVIPTNARIAFDARSDAPEGDIKAEAWGDGVTGATGVSYDDASSYITIFGGWGNSRHVLARLAEHGDDAIVLKLRDDPETPAERRVAQGQGYRFVIERKDGRTIRWLVDDELIAEMADVAPLHGDGHDHFAFNDWSTRVCFDNLHIEAL